MNDIEKLARTIKTDAAKSGVVKDAETIARPEEYEWFVREIRTGDKRLGEGGKDE